MLEEREKQAIQIDQISSNQFYLYSPKLQSHCLNGLYNLYSEPYPLSLDPRFEWGKHPMLMEKRPFHKG